MGSAVSSLSPEKEGEVFAQLKTKYEDLKQNGVEENRANHELKQLFHTLVKKPTMQQSKTWAKLYEFGTPNDNVYQLGDVVKVQAPNSMLFFEGVICGISEDNTSVDVKYTDGDDGFEDELDIPMNSERLRRVQGWDVLEPGDQVKVKVGYLAFEGTVVDVFSTPGKVLVNFGEDGDGSIIEELHDVEVCTKVKTNRLPHLTWQEAIRSILLSNTGTRAFDNRNSTKK